MIKKPAASIRIALLGLPLLINWACAKPCFASVPHLMNLQGRLTDTYGNPIQSSTQVEFRIFQGGSPYTADSGTMVYREIASVTPTSDGSYNYLLGSGSPVGGFQFTSAIFDTSQPIYLQLEISNQSLLPRLQIVSAGTAMLVEFPTGFIGMFALDCPAGWTRFSNLNGTFPRGADTGTIGGGTGGSATHGHTLGTPTTVENGDWLFASPQGSGSHPQNFALADHLHSVSTESNLPPYFNVVFCQKS